MTEPDAGSDATNIQTRARLEGDHYVLDGKKAFITNAPIADLFTVIARTGPGIAGAAGLSAFLDRARYARTHDRRAYRKWVRRALPYPRCS